MKWFRHLSVLVATAFIATSCANGSSGSQATGSSGGSPQNVRIVATFISSIPAMAALKVADQRGYFKDSGLNLSFASAIGGGDTLRPLTTGDADIAIGSPAASTLAVQSNPNLKIAAIWLPYNPFYFAGIEPLGTANGAKLGGSTAASTVNLLIDGLDQKMGVTFNIQKAGTGSMADNWDAVKAGDLQASWVMQPFLTQKEQTDQAKVVIDGAKYIPNYPADFVVVNEQFAKAHSAAMKAFFISVQRIFNEFPQRDKQTALANSLAKVMTFPPSVIKTYLTTESTTILQKTYSLKMNAGVFSNISNLMQGAKLVQSPVSWSKYVDQSYLPPADQLPSL